MKTFKRGQVWFYQPSVEAPGHIQRGPRPVVIVSNDDCNAVSDVLLVVPCTAKPKPNLPTHVYFVSGGVISIALAEQAGPVCAEELIELNFNLDDYIMDQLDTALKIAFGLVPVPKNSFHSEVQQSTPDECIQSVKKVTPKSTSSPRKWTVPAMKCFIADYNTLPMKSLVSKYGLSSSNVAYAYYSKFKRVVE